MEISDLLIFYSDARISIVAGKRIGRKAKNGEEEYSRTQSKCFGTHKTTEAGMKRHGTLR